MSKLHRILGYAGLVPFVVLSLASWHWPAIVLPALASYAALILSFLAGLLWLASTQRDLHWHGPCLSVSLMLLAWLGLLSGHAGWLPTCALLLIALHGYERSWLSTHYAPPLLRLRAQLTTVAALALLGCAWLL